MNAMGCAFRPPGLTESFIPTVKNFDKPGGTTRARGALPSNDPMSAGTVFIVLKRQCQPVFLDHFRCLAHGIVRPRFGASPPGTRTGRGLAHSQC
jgi:hypothetical protein